MSARRISRGLNEALRYAARGWCVHPLHGKAPILKGWPERITTNPRQINKWWHKHIDANVGIATGTTSKLLVIDVDNKNGVNGHVSLRDLEDQYGSLPDTLKVKTPNGEHYYFKHPGIEISNSVGRIGVGLDIRSDGGYVVGPPSQIGGERYRWLNQLEPASLPREWLDLLQSKNSTLLQVIEEGLRDDTIFREACRLRAQNVPEEEAHNRLLDINRRFCAPPLRESQVEKCLRSAWKHPPGYRSNDLGNAQRYVDMFGDRVRYVVELKCFIGWEGDRWQVDMDDLGCLGLMKESNRRIFDEARDCTDPDTQKRLLRYAVTALNTYRLKSSLESVKSEPGVKVHVQDLDADPYLLGVTNGVIDLRTGDWHGGRKEDLITKSAGCAYVENAQCPLWHDFLDRIMGGDTEVIEYLQRTVGYSLTGLTVEQILFFLLGFGANGKTVFIETIKRLLGDYARTMRTEVVMAGSRNRGGPSEDEARLVGSRFVTVNETSEGMRFNEALVKDLTGGDTISARHLYQNSFEFIPQFKLWIRGNHKPAFDADDGGMSRRIKLIPFDVRIPEGERDPHLIQKLRDEMPGILNWATSGCLHWQADGLYEPAAVTNATAEYLGEMDTFGLFLSECCKVDRDKRVNAGTLHRAYRYWCYCRGINAFGAPRVGQILKSRGFTKHRKRIKGKVIRGWRGLAIRAAAVPPENWRPA